MRPLILAVLAAAALPAPAFAWGGTAHAVIDRAAIEAIPDDGPTFLRRHADYIAGSASLPDGWRADSEPFSKIEEDPNHGWFKEQFAFLKPIPRSRYAFVLALHKHYEEIRDKDPEAAQRTNVRWTGTLPYAAMEAYERLIACMRQIRALRSEGKDTAFAEQHCAFQVIRLGHYIGDGDMFDAVLAFLDDAAGRMEQVYVLEKRDRFDNFQDRDVREMVYSQTAKGAAMLRDMICRAWSESAKTFRPLTPSPLDPANPAYDPETGSAPPLSGL